MIAPLFPWRPIGRDAYPTGARFCSLPSKHPPVESGGVRQIRHTPRYWVAWALCGKSPRIPPSYALDRHLGPRKKHVAAGSKPPRRRLGHYVCACRQGDR
jgi:hypothetical protein